MLPPSYFELLKTPEEPRHSSVGFQTWRCTENSQSVRAATKTYSTDFSRGSTTQLTTNHPFGRIVGVNYLPPVVRTYRTTTSVTRENTVSPPAIRREESSLVTESRLIIEKETALAKQQAAEERAKAERQAQEANERARLQREEDQRRATQAEEENKRRRVKMQEMEDQMRLKVKTDAEEDKLKQSKGLELDDKKQKSKIEGEIAKIKELKKQIEEQERERARKREEEEAARVRQRRKWEAEDKARQQRLEEELLRHQAKLSADQMDQALSKKREDEAHAALLKLRQEEESQEKARRDQERLQWEREQQDRLQRLERDRQDREREDKERRDRLEKETLERERERLDREAKLERERKQWELEEKGRRDKLERERGEREAKEKERRDRLDKEERERRDALDREEVERRARIQQEEKAERARIEKERAARVIEEQERRQKEEKERLERSTKDAAERDRLQLEWSKRMEKERVEKERQDAERSERLKLERERWESEREAKEKKDRERYEEERNTRKKQEDFEREKCYKEREELSELVKQELNRLEQARIEFQRFEEEKLEKQREEEAKVRAEKEHARKLIEMIKSSRTPKENKAASNKKTSSFRQMVNAAESCNDTKKLDIPSDSLLSTTLNTLASSRNFQSLPHPSRSSKKLPHHNLSTQAYSQISPTDLPDTPSSPVPQQRNPSWPPANTNTYTMDVERPSANDDRREGYYTEDDLFSKSQSKVDPRLEGRHAAVYEQPTGEMIDYEQIEREAQELRSKIKAGIAKNNGTKPQHSVVEYGVIRPTSRSNSAKKRANIAQSVESINRSKSRAGRSTNKEILGDILGGAEDRIRYVTKNEPVKFTNPIIANKTASKYSNRNYNETDLFNSTEGSSLQKTTEFRENFYKTKSSIKFELDQNPLMSRTADGFNHVLNMTDAKALNESVSKSRRDLKTMPQKKSLYDMTPASATHMMSVLGGSAKSACSHHGKPCCNRFGAKTQSGHHCCHCFLIKSDVHNSNNKYNSALVTLNTGSVLRSLIKESHCEETH